MKKEHPKPSSAPKTLIFITLKDNNDDVIARGQIYEQRNVGIKEAYGEGVSYQFYSIDAVLQTFNDIARVEFKYD